MSTLPPLRVLIVDDEPLVRRGLRAVVSATPGYVVAGEARNGREALELLRTLTPDILFLDVHMPARDGFDLLAALPPQTSLAIIFVTAHSEYAVRAFDVNAADYVLKPFDAARVRLALARARARREGSPSIPFRDTDRQRTGTINHLLLKNQGHVQVVPLDTVRWIEASGNYVRIHATAGVFRMRITLADLGTRLSSSGFAQVHRSALVNVRHVRHLVPNRTGDGEVVLNTGARVALSRTFRDALRARLERQGE